MSILARLQMSEIPTEYNGLSYRGSNLISLQKLGIPDAVILAGVKAWLRDEVDAQAERLRDDVLTPGSGQAMEYQEVQAQARAATADPADATPAKYPMLAATIGLDIDPTTKTPATDIFGVARAVLAQYDAWNAIGASIRATRRKGKTVIEATTDVVSAVAAFDALAWPQIEAA